MKLRLTSALVLAILVFGMTTSVAAQSYSFQVPQMTVHAYWTNDGTLSLDYFIVFANDAGAHVIDFVDVGMPNGDFVFSTISADVNGSPLSISSDFQGDGPYGFAVDMGGYAIQPGQTGQLHISVGLIRNVIYPDDNEPDTYVSGEFAPAYWTTAHGSTSMNVIFHLPPGIQSNEPRYHPARGGWPCDSAPATAYDDQGRVQYSWTCANASAASRYTFGTSFPKQYVPEGSIVTAPSFNIDLSGIMNNLGTVLFFCCFGGIFIGAPILGAVNERKRKLQYLPPKIAIEGHGIKRGLTAVEAAILMEQPLDKVMTMILFGVVKKGAAEVVRRDPLEVRAITPRPEGLHEYEKDFVDAFADANQANRRKALHEMTINLVKGVSDKMKGFSRRESIDYYKSIMERAWQQIEAAGTPEVKSDMYEQALEWTMLDKDYDERTRRTFTGPIFVPMWWGRFDPGYRPTVTGGAAPKASVPTASGGGRTGLPGSAVAASIMGNVQGFSSRVLGDVRAFTSGVTNRTNPVPKAPSGGGKWSGGGGGGHSCACACACAGCACACAGGGR